MLFAPVDSHTEHQAQRTNEVRVVVVTRPAKLLRGIPQFGALLVSVQRLDRVVDIQHIRFGQ